MKIADPRENGVAMRSASPQVQSDPAMKISAPMLPPPAILSAGAQSADPKNSRKECLYTRNVDDPLYTRNAPITIVRRITNSPQTVIRSRHRYSLTNMLFSLPFFISPPASYIRSKFYHKSYRGGPDSSAPPLFRSSLVHVLFFLSSGRIMAHCPVLSFVSINAQYLSSWKIRRILRIPSLRRTHRT